MSVESIRRKNLEKLLRADPSRWPTKAALAREAGITPQLLNSVLNPAKPFGEKAARNIERGLKLPPLALDFDETVPNPPQQDAELLALARRFGALPPRERAAVAALIASLESQSKSGAVEVIS